MSLSVFYYNCICTCLRSCRSFNPSLCRLSPFHLFSVTVSRAFHFLELTLLGLILWALKLQQICVQPHQENKFFSVMVAKHFQVRTEEEIEQLIQDKNSKSTNKLTQNAVKTLKEFWNKILKN